MRKESADGVTESLLAGKMYHSQEARSAGTASIYLDRGVPPLQMLKVPKARLPWDVRNKLFLWAGKSLGTWGSWSHESSEAIQCHEWVHNGTIGFDPQ